MTSRDASATTPVRSFFTCTTPRKRVSRGIFCLGVLFALAVGALAAVHAMRWVGRPFPGFLLKYHSMTVASQGLPSWSGFEAGLRPSDSILAVNGTPIRSGADFELALAAKPPGDEVRYTVQRGAQSFELTSRTQRFGAVDLIMTFGLTFLLGMVFLLLGGNVFLLKPDTSVSWVFFSASLLQAVTLFVDFDVCSIRTPFSYLVILSNAAMPALLLHLSLIFPFRFALVQRRPWLAALPYLVAALICAPLMYWYPSPLYSRVYDSALYPFIYLSILSFLASLSYSYFTGVSRLARQRARTIFWGTAFAFPVPAAAAILINTGWNIQGLTLSVNLTMAPIVLFPAAIAYSITRHNLFDVDVYLKRAVGYGLMTAIVGTAYFLLQVTLKSVLLAPLLGSSAEYIYPVLFALLVVFLFNPVSTRVQGVVDRIFFRKKLDYKEAVLSIVESLSSVLNLEEVVHQINRAVRREMFIDRSGVIVLDVAGAGDRLFLVSDSEAAGGPGGTESLPEGDPLVELVCREKRLITKYDLAEDPRYQAERDRCGARFAELEASLAIPLVYQDQVNGVIVVGHKKSGHYFNKEDIELLVTLASHGAVSLQNARLAEQMQKEEIVRTNLSRYLSPQIVDSIVKSDVQVNLGGDRKTVTVLFSDIRNFTSITESRPADQLVRLLNEYFSAMAEVIFAHQGSLDKYIGDAIVAVFGSLIPLAQAEQAAVSAAVGMMRRLEELNRQWEERGDFPMQMGIGINTGEVFLGNIGSADRMEFTVIGDTVNVASRFSSLAHAGQVLVTRSVLPGLGAGTPIKEHPPSEIKGKTGKLEIFEVLYGTGLGPAGPPVKETEVGLPAPQLPHEITVSARQVT